MCGGSAAQGLAGHWLVGGRHFHCASLALYFLFIIIIISFLSDLLSWLYLNP